MIGMLFSAILVITIICFCSILSYVSYDEIKMDLASSFREVKIKAVNELLSVIVCYISLAACALYSLLCWSPFSLFKLYAIIITILYSIYCNYDIEWIDELLDFTVYNQYREIKIKIAWGIGIACIILGLISYWF